MIQNLLRMKNSFFLPLPRNFLNLILNKAKIAHDWSKEEILELYYLPLIGTSIPSK